MQNPVTPDKAALYWERHLFTKRPVTLELSITNACSFHCTYCRFEKNGRHMKADEAAKLITRAMLWGVRGVVITGGGEPLMHPEFQQITNTLDLAGLPYGLNTNFSRPCPDDIRPVWVKFSIHADTNDRCIENLSSFRQKHAFVDIGAQIIAATADDARRLWRQYQHVPCDYFSIRPIESLSPVYTDQDRTEMVATIEELHRIDPRVVKHYKWDFLWRRFPQCVANWTVVFVDADGNVPYCCHKPTEIIGRWDERDILERRQEALTDMAKCEVPCRQSGNNTTFMEADDGASIRHKEFL